MNCGLVDKINMAISVKCEKNSVVRKFHADS